MPRNIRNQEAKELKYQYIREWRRKHPEKVREYNERYWENRLAKQKEKNERDGNNG